ncbi:hypothetical protein I656_00668 [Geobacillus sp. WSUCF1]|nr:hypothetical protein I656_00668 [Geobacillus sp. WSUCF1]
MYDIIKDAIFRKKLSSHSLIWNDDAGLGGKGDEQGRNEAV